MKRVISRLTATNILIVLCVFVYVLDKYLLIGDGGMFEPTGIADYVLGFCGGNVYMALCHYDGGEIWRLITFLFPHLFILHLAVNMIAFFIVGNKVESRYGSVFVVAAFFIIGVANLLTTNALPFLDTTDTATAGASGAVFGFMGIAAMLYWQNKEYRKMYSKKQKWVLAIYGILFTYFMGDWTMFCHNIGFVMGLAVGFCLILIDKKSNYTANPAE